ncbi:MAG: PD-(D/E)XK nuclease-like domain-containing protein [Planctomycetota bacterium]|jgi:hypothetical protein
MTPEIKDISFSEYQADEGLNASVIKQGRISMKHMHEAIHGSAKRDTPAMKMGRLMHSAILEPDSFFKSVAIWDGKRSGKEFNDFVLERKTHNIITSQEADKLERCRDSVYANAHAKHLITTTQHEQSIFWEGDTVKRCKARLDGVAERPGVLELKTTGKIGPDEFARTAHNMAYLVQFGWYALAANLIYPNGGWPPVHCICLEQQAPFDCVVYRIPAELVKRGCEEAIEIAKLYRISEELEHFDGVASEIVDFALPSWAEPKQEDWEVS